MGGSVWWRGGGKVKRKDRKKEKMIRLGGRKGMKEGGEGRER